MLMRVILVRLIQKSVRDFYACAFLFMGVLKEALMQIIQNHCYGFDFQAQEDVKGSYAQLDQPKRLEYNIMNILSLDTNVFVGKVYFTSTDML